MSIELNHSDRYDPPRKPEGDGPSVLAWLTVGFGAGAWIALPVVGAVAAVVFGLIERRKIAEGTSAPEGKKLVTAGLVCAVAQLAVVGVAVVKALLLAALFALGLMVA